MSNANSAQCEICARQHKEGGLLGEIASRIDFLWWLSYGQSFGLSEPLQLDLSVIKITFSLMFKINIASILGMSLAIYIYRKV